MDPRHHRQGEGHEIGEGEMQADPAKGIEAMKNKLKEIEDEAAAFKVMQAQVSREITIAQDLDDAAADAAAIQAKKEESDSRSIYVGNVDYACTPEEIQHHFQSCGTVNRITIRTDKFGQPKGFAYVEFEEIDAVQNALMLNESELHGRQLKVSAKRTNIPGMKQYRARRPNPCVAFVSYTPHPFYPTNVYGRSPRYRRPARYRPY